MNDQAPFVLSYRLVMTVGRENTHVNLVKVYDRGDQRILARDKGFQVSVAAHEQREMDDDTFLWLVLSAYLDRLAGPRSGRRRPPRGATGGQGGGYSQPTLNLDLRQ